MEICIYNEIRCILIHKLYVNHIWIYSIYTHSPFRQCWKMFSIFLAKQSLLWLSFSAQGFINVAKRQVENEIKIESKRKSFAIVIQTWFRQKLLRLHHNKFQWCNKCQIEDNYQMELHCYRFSWPLTVDWRSTKKCKMSFSIGATLVYVLCCMKSEGLLAPQPQTLIWVASSIIYNICERDREYQNLFTHKHRVIYFE